MATSSRPRKRTDSAIVPIIVPATSPKDPYANFQATLDDIASVVHLIIPHGLKTSVKSSKRRIGRQLAKGASFDPDVVDQAVRAISKEVDLYIKGRLQLQEFMSVMLVTGVEAYLIDSVTMIASKDPRLLKNAESIDCRRIFEASSIESLREDVSRDWARRLLAGPPSKFVKTLAGLGARLPKDSIVKLGHLWATRNLIVHARSIADALYVAQHAARMPDLKVGHRVPIRMAILLDWIQAAVEFVDGVQPFFTSYRDRQPDALAARGIGGSVETARSHALE